MNPKAVRDQTIEDAVEAHSGQLLALIRSMVRDQIETEDVYQDVLEEFIATYDIGAAVEKLGAWLMTVARNKILDRFRRKRTREEYQRNAAAEGAQTASADEEWQRTFIRERISEALDMLPDEQREVFVMHELEGKSFEQIRVLTGAPLGTVLARKRYAINFLREYLKEIYDDLE